MAPLLPLSQRLQRRPRNRICGKTPEQIKLNARIRQRIKARCGHTATQLDRPAARDLDVDALRIRLCATDRSRSMQSDDFVAQHVVPRREVRDREVPAKRVLDQVVGDPRPGVGAGFPCGGGDFRPGEGRGGNAGEVAGYRGDVVDYRAGVGDGPGILSYSSVLVTTCIVLGLDVR